MDGRVVVYPEGLIILRIAIEGDTLENTNKKRSVDNNRKYYK